MLVLESECSNMKKPDRHGIDIRIPLLIIYKFRDMGLILKKVFDHFTFLNELSASLLCYHIWFTTVLVILTYRCCESAVN